jgi:hypothetical protein
MRPSHIIPLTWLPLSSNGKTDAKILLDIFKNLSIQELTGLMSDDKEGSSEACSETEAAVFAILKTHAPSYPGAAYPGLSVFECGLDSMAVIRFTSDLKARFERPFSASDIMKQPTLKEIARLAAASGATSSTQSNEDLVPAAARDDVYASYPTGSVETVLPPFPIQPGVVTRSTELNTLYVQHVLLKSHDKLSLDEVKNMTRAWNDVIARHPMLR